MKLLLLLIVLFIVGYSQSFAQLRLSASDRTDIKLITSERLKISDSKSPEIANYFPINKINNDWYLSFIGKINNEFDKSYFQKHGMIVGSPIASVVSLKIKLDDLAYIQDIKGIDYL